MPRLRRTTDEIVNVLRALDGGYVPAGPSGPPTRGLVSVLPTGRNFYSVDPKAIPSRTAWDVGQALAASLLRRHREDTGAYPRSVGITVWGTSAMRTQGADLAEVFALLGVRPAWDAASRRVTGFEIIPAAEIGRPRIDVTVRVSGFFRDAFPHVIAMIDEAIQAVADLEESDERNYVRAHARADERAEETRRVFRSRVVNPKWIAAMQRHGYKGAFEQAATVDYLFGYDATAGVVDDWMYERLAAAYVFDETNAAFMRRSNPWTLRGIAERLLEAAERGLWEQPREDTLDRLRTVYLELEGELEGD